METVRKPLQGVWNIVRFNWHFYVLAAALAGAAAGASAAASAPLRGYLGLAALLVLAPVVVSLAVSWYVYDFSGLYTFSWVPALPAPAGGLTVLSINAGFDEASALLQRKFRPRALLAFDFYDPARHREISIKRARKAYPPFPGTQRIGTGALPLPDAAVDVTFAFLAAHEIRDAAERATFFREINRVTKPAGRVIVAEHLRDTANFLAYNIGYLHFHPRAAWLATFRAGGLAVEQELKITPFISVFVLTKHGATP